jgi:prepilin-type processing-associated H-X9-DG protein
MKTVRDACQLQPNSLSIKLSDQIEQLDELISAEEDGRAFFEKTFITQGMQDLITEGIARLAGASSQAVFHLKQAMGGGKTHLLVGFGLLARHADLRKTYCAGMPHASAFNGSSIAAFNGRNTPDHFFWGEIANQLGRGEMFKAFWTGGPKAPDEKDWLKLFEGDQPILILLDEMPPYFNYLDTQKVGNGTVADIATRAFACLLTAAGKKKNVCVVVSDLAAAYDTGAKLINRALEDARSELGRQERNITPVDLAANEIYDILRKRLFKSIPDKAEIGDGQSNTLLIGERPPSPDFWYGWWYATGQGSISTGDVTLGVAELNPSKSGGTSTYLEDCPPGPYSYIAGNNEQCDTLHFWSWHSGGANFALADGSVRLIPYSISAATLQALATRAGGETVSVSD